MLFSKRLWRTALLTILLRKNGAVAWTVHYLQTYPRVSVVYRTAVFWLSTKLSAYGFDYKAAKFALDYLTNCI